MENLIEPEKAPDLEKLKAVLRLIRAGGYKKSLGITRSEFDEFKKQLEGQVELKVFNKTAGFKKLENYVNDLARRPKFHEFLKYSRKKFGIPEKGYEYAVVKKEQKKAEVANNIWNNKEFEEYVKDFCSGHKLPGLREFIASYILFNDIKPVAEEIGVSVVKVVDISALSGKKADALAVEAEKNLPPKIKGKLNANAIAQIGKLSQLMSYSETYPIAILVNPYMSQRDIIDAVKNLYATHIEPLQKGCRMEGVELGKIRKKSKRAEERNKFIYDNRIGKSTAQLVRMVSEKYGEVMDYTYINRIIKEEREKNK